MSANKKNMIANKQHASTDEFDARQHVPALVWFYGLWVGLATLSSWVGHSYVSTPSSMFLLAGIIATNCFFMSVSRLGVSSRSLARKFALYQTILGIAWTTAYFYFSIGGGDLVLGMYMTVLMFAVFHLDTRSLLLMSIAAVGSHLGVIGIKAVSAPLLVAPLADGLRFLVLAAIVTWVYIFARKLSELRFELQYRNEELQNVVERVTRIAEEDHLTKSYNRRHIMEVLAREKARADRSGQPFAIVLFDLDHFKTINDRFGHLVGDQILTDFAAHVKKELRGMDSVNSTEQKRSFGRYGGEEFLAVLPATGNSGGERCAERIRGLIAGHAFRDRYNITVSAGVAEYQLGETVPQLLTRADDALYRAKRAGRNRVCCDVPPQRTNSDTVPNLRILK